MAISIQSIIESAVKQLIHAGINDSAKLDAELLLAHSLDKNRTYLYTWSDSELSPEQEAGFKALLEQRLLGHPVAHIIGSREFWGLPLKVTADTLIPRPDTETLVETVLSLNLKPEASLVDLGTGTGAIALALKSELKQAKVIAVDQSHAALKVAKYNGQNLNLDVEFIESNWFSAFNGQTFDCIVSNPPYIEANDKHLNEGDVRFEPISALASGEDGLDDIKTLTEQSPAFLNNGGWLCIEHGYNQAEQIQSLFEKHGYQNIQLKCDLAGNPRVTYGQFRTSL